MLNFRIALSIFSMHIFEVHLNLHTKVLSMKNALSEPI